VTDVSPAPTERRAVADRFGPRSGVRLHLLSGFLVTVAGVAVQLPESVQRLVAFLAVHERPLRRAFVAASLWIDATEEHAMASLRSALWRLRRPGLSLVEANGAELSLGREVGVDLRDATALARRVLGSDHQAGELTAQEPMFDLLTQDVLPDWYEDWALMERERFRQIRLHALERLCQRLTAEGVHGEAIAAGLHAVQAEPLRESAHRALIQAHLAEGNIVEAVRQYSRCQRVLSEELGVEPSLSLQALVAGLTPTARPV
jgi:DNA-binding SARP family transcriptional activator